MLKRKMFRDIKQNMSQFITIFLMTFLGVFVYAGIRSYMGGMTVTANKFYEENNLQDLNVLGYSFTSDDLNKLKDINHVKDAERKLTLTASMEKDRVVQINFIESNNISRFYIMDGEKFDVNKKGVWLDNFFAKNNNIKIGDTISIKYDGITLTEKVIGLINVPDHVYDIKDESELFPDHTDYGFAYLSINELPASYIKSMVMEKMNINNEVVFDSIMPNFNYKDYVPYNSIIVDVDNEKNKDSVKSDIENNISSAIAVTDVKDSISYSVYQGEIEEGETYVGIFSFLFLFIAVLSVITTMTRVVKKQRYQIGTLKSLGFKKNKITMHYVSYGFFISLLAAILGIILGPLLIGNLFIGMEMSYFQIPNGKATVESSSYLIAFLVIIIISIVTYFTCRGELKSSPAEALRPKMPTIKNNSLDITSKGVFKKMSFSTKWNLRDILRNKVRTFMGIVGISGCCMILVCAFGVFDTMHHFIDWQFDELYNFDYKISLKEDYSADEYNTLINDYGNSTSETLGVEVVNGDKKESNTVFVTDADDLVRFTGVDGDFIKLKSNGIYVTKKLAQNKNYKIGDTIKWHIYGDDKYYESKIIGFDRDPQNQNIKMTKEYLENLGIKYKADTIYTNKDMSKIKELDGVTVIQSVANLEEGMSSMLNTMESMVVLLIVVAAILGAVIIYNLGILSFTEKQYQFATLKVLGFKNNKIRKIYVKQNNWITIISIIIGLPLGLYMTNFIFTTAISDSYDMNAFIKGVSYLYAAVGTLIVSYLSSYFLSRKVNKIDMVSSLKGNE